GVAAGRPHPACPWYELAIDRQDRTCHEILSRLRTGFQKFVIVPTGPVGRDRERFDRFGSVSPPGLGQVGDRRRRPAMNEPLKRPERVGCLAGTLLAAEELPQCEADVVHLLPG